MNNHIVTFITLYEYIVEDSTKSANLLFIAKISENTTEPEVWGHCIWVDANSKGRYQILDHAAEVKLILEKLGIVGRGRRWEI